MVHGLSELLKGRSIIAASVHIFLYKGRNAPLRCAPGADGPESQRSHDDGCGVCRQGGELLCCDGCRAAFHLACLRMTVVPPGDWFCAVCADGA